MGLKDKLSDDLKDAMRASDARRRDVLRSVLTAISNTEIARVKGADDPAGRQALADQDVLEVVRKQARQRRESIEEFRKGNRPDLVQQESEELAILEAYLPQQLGRDEIEAEVRTVIAETGAAGPGDKAKVMPAAIARLKGRADGRLINEVVTALLSGS